MAQYKVIYRDENVGWQEGCPLLIEAVQVSRNVDTSQCYLQLKVKNISAETVDKVVVKAEVQTPQGETETASFESLDAGINPGAEWKPQAKTLATKEVAAISVRVTVVNAEVSFRAMAPLAKPKEISLQSAANAERDAEIRKARLDPEKLPFASEDHGAWWICSCGGINVGRASCCCCGAEKAAAASFNETERYAKLAAKHREEKIEKAKGMKETADASTLQAARDALSGMENDTDAADAVSKLDVMISAKRKKRNRLIGIVVAVVIVASIGLAVGVNAAQRAEAERIAAAERAEAERIAAAERAEAELKKEQGSALLKGTLSVGDVVPFGLYEQDGNTGNGKEVITWRVLAVEGDRVLLISEYGLDCREFNSSKSKGNDWEGSDLKAWLTGTFKTAAFTSEQQAQVAQITCLGVDEANAYFSSDKDRVCKPTAYAKTQGVWTSSSGACIWWLRSPGSRGSESAAYVYYFGHVYTDGRDVDYDINAVRPALWLTL